MKFNCFAVIAYACVVLIGGLIGYLLRDSAPSLLWGSIAGAILFASGIGLLKSSRLAFFSALSVSLALSLFFAYRYFITFSMIPAGWMVILSLLIFLLLLSTKSFVRR